MPYTKGFTLPLMRPIPIPIPDPSEWWNIKEKVKALGVRLQSRKWLICEDYQLDLPWIDEIVCIPKGFIFDGASVPRFLWPLLSPTGPLFIPGLYHDFGYRYNSWVDMDYNPIHQEAGKRFFDDQFRVIGDLVSDDLVVPNIAWVGLITCGFIAWNGRRKENHVLADDFPVKVTEIQ